MGNIKDKQIKVLSHYGLDKQLQQLLEECSELIQAICKWNRYNTVDTFTNLVEELSDVKNMIQQIELSNEYIESATDKFIVQKLDRQIQRIEESRNEN